MVDSSMPSECLVKVVFFLKSYDWDQVFQRLIPELDLKRKPKPDRAVSQGGRF